MDTGDTGDTGILDPKEEIEIVSAAELAGEEGGLSCSTAAYSSLLSALIVFVAIVFRRRSHG